MIQRAPSLPAAIVELKGFNSVLGNLKVKGVREGNQLQPAHLRCGNQLVALSTFISLLAEAMRAWRAGERGDTTIYFFCQP